MHEVRLGGLVQEMHPALVQEMVGLARVAGGAGGDDVGPDVEPAARDGDHMVAREGLAWTQLILGAPAVHAAIAVAREEEGVRHLPAEAARHMDEFAEADDQGARDGEAFGAHRAIGIGLDDLGFAVDDKTKGPLERDHREGFVRRIEGETPCRHSILRGSR